MADLGYPAQICIMVKTWYMDHGHPAIIILLGNPFMGKENPLSTVKKKHALFFGLISSNFRPVHILVGGFNHLQKYWSVEGLSHIL
jgi:hypothetical protein